MSAGARPAIAKARGPDSVAGVERSGAICESCVRAVAAPKPDSSTGFWRKSCARSALVITTAPPPSVTTQQSSLCSGEAIMGEASTSSTVIGVRSLA
ncbi:Uncharacterised protein [Bordetella pertussis]|nr:Uncharacterised protein [Bordetella pertussis]